MELRCRRGNKEEKGEKNLRLRLRIGSLERCGTGFGEGPHAPLLETLVWFSCKCINRSIYNPPPIELDERGFHH